MKRSGAYIKVKMAIPNSIHSKPMVLTKVPLKAGPVSYSNYFINLPNFVSMKN